MAIAEKLAPPVIDSTIPAFFEDENNQIKIIVPFKHSKIYTFQEGDYFSLKIKTSQSNSFIDTLTSTLTIDEIGEYATFIIPESDNDIFQRFKIGQYYKFQLAYKRNLTPGYFSTVATGKYTLKPEISINSFTGGEHINYFSSVCTGVYTNLDTTEKPYYFKFILKKDDAVIEDSGWQMHIFSTDDRVNDSSYIYYDTYTMNTSIEIGKEYALRYIVKTINNLVLSTDDYRVAMVTVDDLRQSISLEAKNDFDNGYISLHFQISNDDISNLPDSEDYDLKFEPLSLLIERAQDTDNFSSWKRVKILNFKNLYLVSDFVYKDYTISQGMFYQYRFSFCDSRGDLSSPTMSEIVYADFEDIFLYDGTNQVKIRFNPKVNSFKENILEQKIDTIGNQFPFFFRNGAVKYKEFPISGLISYIMDDDLDNEFFKLDKRIYVSGYNDISIDNKIYSEVNDNSIYYQKLNSNSETYLKIKIGRETDIIYYSLDTPSSINDLQLITDANRGNVLQAYDTATSRQYYQKISLFDKNLKFQKISVTEAEERQSNGNIWYCAICPWSNLALTRLAATDNFIFDPSYFYYELVYVFNEQNQRDETSSFQDIRRNIFATSLTGYTVRTEREFKTKLMQWLNNGKIKMFKSPYEGNFLVRLMNISLTPVDQLGRMLHNFQCQAYEIDNFNFLNLEKYNIISSSDFSDAIGALWVEKDDNVVKVSNIGINSDLTPIINEAAPDDPGDVPVSYIVDTQDGTATNSDIKYGKVAYSRGNRLVGTLRNGNEVGF